MTLGNRRLILAGVSVLGILALEGLHVYRGGSPSIEGMAAIGAIVGAYCGFDMGTKIARARAGVTEAQAIEQEKVEP